MCFITHFGLIKKLLQFSEQFICFDVHWTLWSKDKRCISYLLL